MDSFKEYEAKGLQIIDVFEVMLMSVAVSYAFTFHSSPHDIARRLLNEIVEFKPLGEGE